MNNNPNRTEQAKSLFAQYPLIKVFHITSDNQAFFKKVDAQAHAKSLKDSTVEELHKSL